jgi:site-specific DNA-methyltransferase (adenine-specific)
MAHLVRLVTPPGGLVLDPFIGSGSTAIAALGTGRRCVGIERDESYIALIRGRLRLLATGGAVEVPA